MICWPKSFVATVGRHPIYPPGYLEKKTDKDAQDDVEGRMKR